MPSTYLTISFVNNSQFSESFRWSLGSVDYAKTQDEGPQALESALLELQNVFPDVTAETPWWAAIRAELADNGNLADGVHTDHKTKAVNARFELGLADRRTETDWLPAMAETLAAHGVAEIELTLEDDESRFQLTVENGKASGWENIGWGGTENGYDDPLAQQLVEILRERSSHRDDDNSQPMPSEYSLAAIKSLVDNGASPQAKADPADAVTESLRYNDIEVIEYFLSLEAIPLDRDLPEFETLDQVHNTALIWVAEQSDDYYEADDGGLKAMRLLLEAGADPNVKNSDGSLPLSVLSSAGSGVWVPKMKLLLEFGADPMCRNGSGKTPLDKWKYYAKDESKKDNETYKQCYALLLSAAEQKNNGA